jgi:hypothetical protein
VLAHLREAVVRGSATPVLTHVAPSKRIQTPSLLSGAARVSTATRSAGSGGTPPRGHGRRACSQLQAARRAWPRPDEHDGGVTSGVNALIAPIESGRFVGAPAAIGTIGPSGRSAMRNDGSVVPSSREIAAAPPLVRLQLSAADRHVDDAVRIARGVGVQRHAVVVPGAHHRVAVEEDRGAGR